MTSKANTLQNPNRKALSGHRAVVTGASSGIGQEYARQLAAMGSDLVIVARRLDRLKALAQELRTQYSVQVQCLELDLLQPTASQQLFEFATGDGAYVTILVSNAGIGKYGSFLEFSLDDHLSTLHVNSVAPTELTYRFLGHMLKHGKRSYMTHVASIAAFQPTSFFSVYSGTKGYLRSFVETLAFELRNSNVSVTCVCPGGTYTEFLSQSGQNLTRSGHFVMMSAKDVVQGSIKAMLSAQTLYVPGLLNKLACFFPRLLPRSLSMYLAFKSMDRAVKRVPLGQNAKPE